MFGQIVPIGVKTLRQDPSRHVKMEMTLVPVEVLRSGTSLIVASHS